MSIFHCSISNVSRAKGSTSLATLSYITATKIFDQRLGQNFSYGRGERVLFANTLVPHYAPKDFHNPSVVFNSLEMFEKIETARTAKKIIVALPKELDPNHWKKILNDYVQENFVNNGYCATYAIHIDKQGLNPHAHILVANRALNSQGEWEKTKTKKIYALDAKGEKIPVLDDKTGKQKLGKRNEKQWKRISVSQNLLDKKEFLKDLRKNWATQCNKFLTPETQIDHRSFKEQGKELLPTVHLGYKVAALERKNIETHKGNYNRAIKAINSIQKNINAFRKNILFHLQKTKTSLKKWLTPSEYAEKSSELKSNFMVNSSFIVDLILPKHNDKQEKTDFFVGEITNKTEDQYNNLYELTIQYYHAIDQEIYIRKFRISSKLKAFKDFFKTVKLYNWVYLEGIYKAFSPKDTFILEKATRILKTQAIKDLENEYFTLRPNKIQTKAIFKKIHAFMLKEAQTIKRNQTKTEFDFTQLKEEPLQKKTKYIDWER